jgi:uncharacterized coiled-coil protein SlyX
VLKQQNRKICEYEETIAELNLKVSQLDVYKQQVLNLQSQIMVLDEKFKLTQYDTENIKIQELETKVIHYLERERLLNNEISSKDQEVSSLF